MATKTGTPLEQLEVDQNPTVKTNRLAGVTLAVSVLQGLCVWFMAIGAVKLILGLGALGAAAGAASFIHSDPVRIPLMVLATLGATATLFVIWNQRSLRNHPAARWRKRPLTTAEKRKTRFAVFASILSYALVIAELFAHRYLHP